MKTFTNEQEMIAFGELLGNHLFPHSLITLTGDLGAGKTTFTKGIGKGLGVKRIINSPTFTIVKTYNGKYPLYHFDAYRLEGQECELGFEEMFDDAGVCIVEWPKYIETILPKQRLEIEILKNDDDTRTMKFHPIGEEYVRLLEEVGVC